MLMAPKETKIRSSNFDRSRSSTPIEISVMPCLLQLEDKDGVEDRKL
jgi:hypothetical protein